MTPSAPASPSQLSNAPAPAALTPAQAAGLDDPELLAQCIVEMPAGSALEDTAATLHDLGAYLAKQPEVQNLQGNAR